MATGHDRDCQCAIFVKLGGKTKRVVQISRKTNVHKSTSPNKNKNTIRYRCVIMYKCFSDNGVR